MRKYLACSTSRIKRDSPRFDIKVLHSVRGSCGTLTAVPPVCPSGIYWSSTAGEELRLSQGGATHDLDVWSPTLTPSSRSSTSRSRSESPETAHLTSQVFISDKIEDNFEVKPLRLIQRTAASTSSYDYYIRSQVLQRGNTTTCNYYAAVQL